MTVAVFEVIVCEEILNDVLITHVVPLPLTIYVPAGILVPLIYCPTATPVPEFNVNVVPEILPVVVHAVAKVTLVTEPAGI